MAGGECPHGSFHWYFTSGPRLLLGPCRRPLLSTFCWPWAQAIDNKIHAWLYKNIRHQENWSRVTLSTLRPLPFPRISWLKRALVVLPVLAPSLNLYPVKTLRYYLARTKDLCKGKKSGLPEEFHKDIIPATISSWS